MGDYAEQQQHEQLDEEDQQQENNPSSLFVVVDDDDEEEEEDEETPKQEQTLVTLDDEVAFGDVNSDCTIDDRHPIPLASTVQERGEPPPYRWKLVFLYVLAIGLLHADYNLLAPNLTEIAQEFGMSSDERDRKLGGEIALSFFLCGVPSALLVGWMTDRLNHRAAIFATVVFIGELSCFATYFVKSFASLLATRSITGIAIGASLPVVYSVLGDLYQAQGRNAISGKLDGWTMWNVFAFLPPSILFFLID
jgi:Arabinose efflux permease